MISFVRLAAPLLPAYRTKQASRLRLTLGVTQAFGALLSPLFIPWARAHTDVNETQATLIILSLALSLVLLCLMTYLGRSQSYLSAVTLFGSFTICVHLSALLALLPDGFHYGVSLFVMVMMVTTVLGIDLRVWVSLVQTSIYLITPNVALLVIGAPALDYIHINWVLLSSAFFSAGLALLMDQSHRQSFLLELEVQEEKRRSDALLDSLLPAKIADQLKRRDAEIAEVVPEATVLFADLVGFTAMSHQLSAQQLIRTLDEVFTRLDDLAASYGLEKIKTIGDAYMLAAGVADAADRSVVDVASFALDALAAIDQYAAESGLPLELRIGFTSGPVVGGVIGKHKPYYDLWGETVNLASRLESSADAGSIQLDARTARALGDGFQLEPRGFVDLRGIGTIQASRLVGRATATGSAQREPDHYRLSATSAGSSAIIPLATAGGLALAATAGDQ